MSNSELRKRKGQITRTGWRILRKQGESARGKRSRFRVRPIALGILGALAAVNSLASQEPQSRGDSPTDPGFVLHQTVRRVRVDVTVTDAQGNLVASLQASDFRLSEDGKPQSIRQFERHGAETKQAPALTRPAMPPHTFMNLPELPEYGPLTVLLYDVLNTPLDAQPYAHKQMEKFLKQSTGQPIALFVLSDRLHLLQGFTSNSELIQRAANDSSTMPQRQPLEATAPTATGTLADVAADEASQAAQRGAAANQQGASPGPLGTMLDQMQRMEALETSSLLDRRVDLTLEAFEQVGRFLSGVAGRKNLIWYSGAFPAGSLPNLDKGLFNDNTGRNYSERMRAATDLLNDAETAVYPVDARGLQTNTVYSASQPSGPGGTLASRQGSMRAISQFGEQISAKHSAMDMIGEETGGRAFYNPNGLDRAMEKASSDGTSYYSLVYAPANNKFDGSVRRISVSLEHNHYHLAYRRSYFADDLDTGANPQATTAVEKTSTESMAVAAQFGAPPSHQLIFAAQVDAIGAPAPATAVQMAALDPYLEQADKAAGRKFVKPTAPIPMQQYAIQYAVLASQLDLHQSENGVYRPHVALTALAFNAEGETLWGFNTRIEDAIPAAEFGNILQNGYRAVQVLLVPVDTAVIRLVVYDENSGRIGSMEARVPL
jgi:VWFA-related protein